MVGEYTIFRYNFHHIALPPGFPIIERVLRCPICKEDILYNTTRHDVDLHYITDNFIFAPLLYNMSKKYTILRLFGQVLSSLSDEDDARIDWVRAR